MEVATTQLQNEIIIGRPPIYIDSKAGNSTELITLRRFLECRAKRRILVAHRRGRKTSTSLEEVVRYLIHNNGIIGKSLAPKRKQAKEIIWDDPDMLFHPNVCPPEIVRNINHSELKIEFKNGSIYYLDGADDPQSKRGGNVKVLHLTEAGDHKEEVWTQVYEPVLLANGGIAIFEGNPRGRNWYYKLFLNASERAGWARFLVSARDTPIFTKEQLDDLERTLPYPVFASEYLCEWVDSLGTVFRSFREIATSSESGPVPQRHYEIGIDLAKVQDYTVVSVVDRHTWGQVRLERWNQLSWPTQKEKIKSILAEYSKRDNGNSVRVKIEGNGVGNPIFDDMVAWAATQPDLDIGLINFKTTSQSKNLLVENFSMLCDQGVISILPYDVLMGELEAFTYEKNRNGIFYAAPDGYHDDTVMATLLSYWELGGKMPLPEEKPQTERRFFGFTEDQVTKMRGGSINTNPFVNPYNIL